MAHDFDSLPETVKTALQRGQQVDAIKLLRQAKGISLKAAKERIEGIAAQGIPAASQQSGQAILRAEITNALAQGRKVSVIRLLQVLRGAPREHAASEPGAATSAELGTSPLAPGEQPRSGGSRLVAWLVVAMAAIGAVLLYRQP
jgi:ribosomal protein L7/L12